MPLGRSPFTNTASTLHPPPLSFSTARLFTADNWRHKPPFVASINQALSAHKGRLLSFSRGHGRQWPLFRPMRLSRFTYDMILNNSTAQLSTPNQNTASNPHGDKRRLGYTSTPTERHILLTSMYILSHTHTHTQTV